MASVPAEARMRSALRFPTARFVASRCSLRSALSLGNSNTDCNSSGRLHGSSGSNPASRTAGITTASWYARPASVKPSGPARYTSGACDASIDDSLAVALDSRHRKRRGSAELAFRASRSTLWGLTMPTAKKTTAKPVKRTTKRPPARAVKARASRAKQPAPSTTAIVLAGAGARGAYEAGVLSVLVPRLLEEPGQRIVLVGTSAGAINTAILAAYDSPDKAVAAMTDLWTTVDAGDIFSPMRESALQTFARYMAEVLHLPGRLNSLLDSTPLGATMEERLDWDQLDENIRGKEWADTAGIVATSCARGRGVVFVQGRDLVVPKRDADVDYARATLRSSHVMASAAIPVAFRPVLIEGPASQSGWYIDGGVKLNAPIKPALALGADR